MLSRNRAFVPAAYAFLVLAIATLVASVLAVFNDLSDGALPPDSRDLVYSICFNYCSPAPTGYELWWAEAIAVAVLVSLIILVFIAVRSTRLRTSVLALPISAAALANVLWIVIYALLFDETFGAPGDTLPISDFLFPIVNLFAAGDVPDITFAEALGAALATALNLLTFYLFVLTAVQAGLPSQDTQTVPYSYDETEWDTGEEWEEDWETEYEEAEDDGDNIPAGWYADPDGKPCQRYWDGDDWTKRTRPEVGGTPAVNTATQTRPLQRQTTAASSKASAEDLPRKARNSLILSIISLVVGPLPFLWILPIVALIYAIRVLTQLRQHPSLPRTTMYWSLGIAIAAIPWMLIIGLTRAINA